MEWMHSIKEYHKKTWIMFHISKSYDYDHIAKEFLMWNGSTNIKLNDDKNLQFRCNVHNKLLMIINDKT